MTEERTSIIEVGDRLVNDIGETSTVTGVQIGKYGLLVDEDFQHGRGRVYFPYELPPLDALFISDWHSWASRGTTTLPNGKRIGDVSRYRDEAFDVAVDDYDRQWERTIEAIEAEEGVMQSRPTDLRLN